MKKSIRLLTGIAALAVLTGSYLLLVRQNEKNAEQEEAAALGDVILEVDDANLTGVSYQIGGTAYSFVQQDGSWKLESDETFPVDETALLSPLNQLDALYAVRTLTDVADSSEYGFEEPQNEIVLTDADGTVTTITIGITNSSTGNDYLMLNRDTSVIYTVDASVRTALAENLYEYAYSEDLPWILATDIVGVEISRADDAYRLYLEDAVWKLDAKGEVREADSDAVNTALSSMAGLSYVDYLEHDCADLSPYGLEEPAAVVTISYREETEMEEETAEAAGTEEIEGTEKTYETKILTFLVGDTDASGNYYVQQEGSGEVHTILYTKLTQMLQADSDAWAAEPETPEEATEATTEATRNETENET